MGQKTIYALQWIIEILNRLNIQYQIAGGFAAKLYGSERELNDIDVEISEKDFYKILPEIHLYITWGPARFKNEKWDTMLIILDYKGQMIDISGVETAKMSNKERTKWIPNELSTFNTIDIEVADLIVKVIHPKGLIEYKKELDGEHQILDIQATEKYLLGKKF